MQLRLIAKQSEGADIVSFVFRPLTPMSWRAGQYMRWSLIINGQMEDHFFTIASPPYSGEPRITTRIRPHSAYKQALNALAIGEVINAAAVDGDFAWMESNLPLIFIANGIGVTPFYSMLLQRAHDAQSLSATLLYIHEYRDNPFRESFDKLMTRYPEFTAQHIIGRPITSELLATELSDLQKSIVYVSGPESSVEMVSTLLKNTGVDSHNLRRDRFSGYEE